MIEFNNSGFTFLCGAMSPEKNAAAVSLAAAYNDKKAQIALYLSRDRVFRVYFGDFEFEQLEKRLGRPDIDIDNRIIKYTRQTINPEYAIEADFEGLFDSITEVRVQWL